MSGGQFKNFAELCDCVSLIAYAPSDLTFMALLDTASGEYYIPVSKVPANSAYLKLVTQDATELFGNQVKGDQLIRTFKYWKAANHGSPCIYYYIFAYIVDDMAKKKSKATTGKFRGKVRWLTESEIIKVQNARMFRGVEIFDCYMGLKNGAVRMQDNFLSDGIKVCGNFLEIADDILITTKSTTSESMVDMAGIDKDTQRTLYRDFLITTAPNCFMSLATFSKMMQDTGWLKDDHASLFRVADVNDRGGVSFRELLYFLAAVEPGPNLTGAALEMRSKYLFRFLDRDKDNCMMVDDVKFLALLLRKSKKLGTDIDGINSETADIYRILNVTENHTIVQPEFSKMFMDQKIKNLNTIFRSGLSVGQYTRNIRERSESISDDLSDRRSMTSAGGEQARRQPSARKQSAVKEIPKMTDPTVKGKAYEYELAYHTIKLKNSGDTINIDQLFTLQDAVSPSTTRQPTLNDARRRVSVDQFNQESVTNEVLKGLRYLVQVNKKKGAGKGAAKPGWHWGQLDSAVFARQLMNVCLSSADIFKKENRLMQVPPPAYIMGDLHGNFNDLLQFENVLWHVGPGLCPCNLLFLGDYVDRGPSSVEVIAYLFCYKIQNPTKLHLLRGNHEIREVQKMFSFYTECLTKFGDKLGQEVWNAINNTFDTMPVAAIVDNSMFCCHGGIPPPWLCPVVNAINDIPVPLSRPDEQSALAWDIMWNDPIKPKAVTEKVAMELAANEGFAVNFRRGTAHIFSVEALDRFLKSNNLTHLIRAHEVVQAGFQIQQRGKLITVFSNAKYCGGQNEAACVLVDNNKLRILRIESDN